MMAWSVGLALAAGLTGCMTARQGTSEAARAKVLDRLVAAYPDDLASKNFQLIADFEDPKQAALFRREPDQTPDAVGISTARAQQETGVGSLKMSFSNSSQQVVVADSPDSQWALHQDWAPYPLLLLSVFSPRDQGGFRFSIRSGTNTPLVYEHPRVFLKSGWNRLRIDLAEVAENVYLGDVRELRFWCDPLDSPIELYLDDIILADNTRALLANTNSAPGEFSIKSQGRRLVVTVTDRFELVFSRGRIRQWFDLSADPDRMHNLAGSGPLGPIPAVIGPGGVVLVDAPTQWLKLGPLAESYQGIVEASPLRVVVHGEWRFGSAEAPVGETSPHHRWIYSIYRGGEVYVECSGSIPGMNLPTVGMVFGCDGAAGFQRKSQAEEGDGIARGIPYVLFSQPPHAGHADLLVIPSRPLMVQALENPEEARVCVLYQVPVEAEEFRFTGQLRVWPNDVDSPALAAPMALAYTRPLPIAVDTGQLVKTDAGDLDRDGYSEARGYYVLQLDGRVAKLRLDGREHLRFSPVFKLVEVSDQDVWVYVNGRQIKDTQRDQNGNLLFEIPGVISREMLIEITATKRQSPTPVSGS
jgi:hypothetical protein